jgi:hypothetical protein
MTATFPGRTVAPGTPPGQLAPFAWRRGQAGHVRHQPQNLRVFYAREQGGATPDRDRGQLAVCRVLENTTLGMSFMTGAVWLTERHQVVRGQEYRISHPITGLARDGGVCVRRQA